MEHDKYIIIQRERFRKERSPARSGEERKRDFIGIIHDKINLFDKKSCLIIGAANNNEADILHGYGIGKITQIDIIANHPGIIEMDMHSLKFNSNSFDYVQVFHCLEHSNDVRKVIFEICRVTMPGGHIAVEIPVNYKTTEIDRIDFKNAVSIMKEFSKACRIEAVYWKNIEKGNPGNFCGTDISRAIMKVMK